MQKATIVVVRNQEGDILLLKRGKDHPRNPNDWCFPGGKVDWYSAEHKVKIDPSADAFDTRRHDCEETYEEAAVRECLEETGIRMTSFQHIGHWLADADFIVKVYHCDTDQVVTREFPNREHVEYRWVNESNYPVGELGTMTREQLGREFSMTLTPL